MESRDTINQNFLNNLHIINQAKQQVDTADKIGKTNACIIHKNSDTAIDRNVYQGSQSQQLVPLDSHCYNHNVKTGATGRNCSTKLSNYHTVDGDVNALASIIKSAPGQPQVSEVIEINEKNLTY